MDTNEIKSILQLAEKFFNSIDLNINLFYNDEKEVSYKYHTYEMFHKDNCLVENKKTYKGIVFDDNYSYRYMDVIDTVVNTLYALKDNLKGNNSEKYSMVEEKEQIIDKVLNFIGYINQFKSKEFDNGTEYEDFMKELKNYRLQFFINELKLDIANFYNKLSIVLLLIDEDDDYYDLHKLIDIDDLFGNDDLDIHFKLLSSFNEFYFQNMKYEGYEVTAQDKITLIMFLEKLSFLLKENKKLSKLVKQYFVYKNIIDDNGYSKAKVLNELKDDKKLVKYFLSSLI